MRKHLTLVIVAVIVIIVTALVFSGSEIAARKDAPENGSSSSSSGYHLVTIADMGISLELPQGWVEQQSSDPAQMRVFMDEAKMLNLMVIAVPAGGKDFTAALAEVDSQTQTAYEGQASIRIQREDPIVVAGMPGTLRHRELLAAGMRDLAAVFELADKLFTVTLRREDGTDPTAEDEVLLQKIAASVRQIQ